MTPFRFDNQAKKKTVSRTRWILWGALASLIIVIIVFAASSVIQRIAAGPAWIRNQAESGIETAYGMLTPKRALLAKIKELEAQVDVANANEIELQTLRSANESLRKELSYVAHPETVIAAQILYKPSDSLYNSLVIDRGTRDGIRQGQLVTSQGTIGLGTVASVTASTATVRLFSGPQFSGDVVMKADSITVPATGRGGGNFEIHIPQSIKVTKGDLIAFPDKPDMTIGIIESIDFDPRDPFQTVLTRTPVNVQELQFVEVVK